MQFHPLTDSAWKRPAAKLTSVLVSLFIAGSVAACSFSGEEAVITDFSDPGVTKFEPERAEALELRAITVEVATGTHLGAYTYDIGCLQSKNLNWNDYLARNIEEKLRNSAFREFEKAELRFSNDPNRLFEDQGEKPNLRLAGSVRTIKLNYCGGAYHIPESGEAHKDVLWQVYDTRQGKVVYEVATQCASEMKEYGREAFDGLMRQTFEVCVRHLIATPAFRDVISGAS